MKLTFINPEEPLPEGWNIESELGTKLNEIAVFLSGTGRFEKIYDLDRFCAKHEELFQEYNSKFERLSFVIKVNQLICEINAYFEVADEPRKGTLEDSLVKGNPENRHQFLPDAEEQTIKGDDMGIDQTGASADVKSRFHFGQEVWFMNGRHIMNGKVVGVRGENNIHYPNKENVEIEISVTAGNMGAKFWERDIDCFMTRKDLVEEILGVKID